MRASIAHHIGKDQKLKNFEKVWNSQQIKKKSKFDQTNRYDAFLTNCNEDRSETLIAKLLLRRICEEVQKLIDESFEIALKQRNNNESLTYLTSE